MIEHLNLSQIIKDPRWINPSKDAIHIHTYINVYHQLKYGNQEGLYVSFVLPHIIYHKNV
jgi:hypothetical protein